MARAKRSLLKWLLPVVVVLVLWFGRTFWLTALGRCLVHTDEPFRADIAVVLAGDGYGHRILRAAELVRDGLTSRVLVSGPKFFYGHSESDLAIPFAVNHGYPEAWFVAVPMEANSTREEAVRLAPELRRLGVRRCLLVTSDYHTRRAGRIVRAAAPEVEFRVIAAPDEYFRPDGWWHAREGQKCFVLEWMKTIASWFGI